jgi:hypothetical protein
VLIHTLRTTHVTSHRKTIQLKTKSAHKQPVITHYIQAEKELQNTWIISRLLYIQGEHTERTKYMTQCRADPTQE